VTRMNVVRQRSKPVPTQSSSYAVPVAGNDSTAPSAADATTATASSL